MQQGVYKHFKGGLYTLIMSAKCSDNGPDEGENVVIYVSHTTGSVCTRLAKNFFGKVIVLRPSGVEEEVDRFSFVSHRLGDRK